MGLASCPPTPASAVSFTKCDNTPFDPLVDKVATCADIPVVTPAADFWRSGSGATLPDGATDVIEDISRMGKVGLGTTTPVTDIHVKKAVTGEVGVTSENTLITASDYADVVTLNGDVKTTLGAYKDGGYGYTGTESNNDFFIYANNNTAIVVKPNQRVGIGSNASVNNPTDTLYVHNGTAGDSGLTLAGMPASTGVTAGAQPIGVDANGKVVRVAVPAFATLAETVAGTSTTLAVNPADLYARENVAAQTGLGLVLSAIPAPTASQSNWGVNTLGETLHYMPGVGWKVVDDKYSAAIGGNVVITTANTWTNVASLVAPRAGKVIVFGNVGAAQNGTNYTGVSSRITIAGDQYTTDNSDIVGLSGYRHTNNGSLGTTATVAAGDIIAIQSIITADTGTSSGELRYIYS
jgi:hypothetical protein